MVIDTSALIAVLWQEPDAGWYADAIAADPVRLMSAVSQLEAAMVVEARGGASGGRELDLLLHSAAVEVVPFTSDQAKIARNAWRRFGKGNHRAHLNIGDCCTYALAHTSGEPLLFKGDDFGLTDLQLVPRAS